MICVTAVILPKSSSSLILKIGIQYVPYNSYKLLTLFMIVVL